MKPKAWKVTGSKLIHQNPWINLIADSCESNGKNFTYTFAERRDEGPYVIAEESDGCLWMVQQYRHPIQKIVWQFPAEGKKPEESWEAAAQRGIEEELGKHAETFIQLGTMYPDPGFLRQTAHLYLATGLSDVQVDKFHMTEEEVEELHTQVFSLDEIEKMIDTGDICDGWTLAALYLYKKHRHR